MGNPVVHFEIIGTDGAALEKFYSELFGWHVMSSPIPGGGTYGLVDTHSGKGINGGIGQTPNGENRVTIYVESSDLQAVLDKAESLGGKTVMPVDEIPGVVTLALFSDPEGNVVGIVKRVDGEQPGVSSGSNPPIDWFEILGTDGKALRKFYRDLFGWEISESMGDFDYGEVKASGRGIGGGVGISQSGGPQTTVYAHVDDLDKYIERAETLGAKTLMPPMDAGETVTIAAIADPQGNVFGLYRSKN